MNARLLNRVHRLEASPMVQKHQPIVFTPEQEARAKRIMDRINADPIGNAELLEQIRRDRALGLIS